MIDYDLDLAIVVIEIVPSIDDDLAAADVPVISISIVLESYIDRLLATKNFYTTSRVEHTPFRPLLPFHDRVLELAATNRSRESSTDCDCDDVVDGVSDLGSYSDRDDDDDVELYSDSAIVSGSCPDEAPQYHRDRLFPSFRTLET